MARPIRLEFAGALYHVTARGDRRADIHADNTDREIFLEVLAGVVDRFNWLLHAYCLMDNHYHLLLETPDGNLSQGMRQLNGVFTQRSNRRHENVGHLFQGRYKAILVDRQSHLLELARYIVLNPMRAGMVRRVDAWPWSSYRATAGRISPPKWLAIDGLLAAFATDRKPAIKAYRRFVAAGRGQPSPWAGLRNQVFLGDDHFVDAMQARIAQLDRPLAEVPRGQRAGRARPIADYENAANTRDEAIVQAYAGGGYSMREVGEYFGLHYSSVSRIVRRHEADSEDGR